MNSLEVRTLTVDYDDLARSLITEVIIQPAFDPGQITETDMPYAPFLAILDTGATITTISQKVVQTLHLHPIGVIQVDSISHRYFSNVYLVNIALRNKVGLSAMHVVEGNIRSADVLLGMDVITRGDLAISNKNGKTTFSFRMPSIERIDFAQTTT